MFAGDQLGQKAALLLVAAVAADLVHAEVGVGAIAQADRRRGTAQLLDRDHVLEIAQPRAAIFLVDGDAVKAEIAHLRPQLARKAVGLVEFRRDRSHFGRGKALDLVA
jgi:hypothetical protein